MARPTLPSIENLLRGVPPTMSTYSTYPSEHLPTRASRHTSPTNIPSPISIGWLNKDQEEVQQALYMIRERGLDVNALTKAAFAIDPNRPLYKEDKRRYLDDDQADTPGKKHSQCEKKRRLRHANWQETAHQMTPEIAHQAVERDRKYREGKSRKTAKKDSNNQKPGKDEQHCSVIYTVTFLGIALDTEHQHRKQAEQRVFELEQRLATLEHQPRKRVYEEDDDASSTRSSKQRALHPSLYRLPPSPSLTATLSPSPTPPLSASASFSY